MYLPTNLKKREPVIGVLSFKDFKTKLIPSLKNRKQWLLSDGMCINSWDRGDSISESEENVVETYVAGGDNNYHYTDEQIQDDTQVSLTASGFFLPDTLEGEKKIINFTLLKKSKLPKTLTTLKELADYQKSNPNTLLFGSYSPKDSFANSLAAVFVEDKKEIQVVAYNHYEDAQEEDTTLPLTHPVTILKDGSAHIKDVPQDCNDVGEYFCAYAPVENVWLESHLFTSLVTVAPTLVSFISTAKANPVKVGKDINDRWNSRIVTAKLSGATGAATYLNNYGKTIQADKLLALAQKATLEGDDAMATAFFEAAFNKNPLAIAPKIVTPTITASIKDPIPATLSKEFASFASKLKALQAVVTAAPLKKEISKLYSIIGTGQPVSPKDIVTTFNAATTSSTDAATLQQVVSLLSLLPKKGHKSSPIVIKDLVYFVSLFNVANNDLIMALDQLLFSLNWTKLDELVLNSLSYYSGPHETKIFKLKCDFLIHKIAITNPSIKEDRHWCLRNPINTIVYQSFNSHSAKIPTTEPEKEQLVREFTRNFKVYPEALQLFVYAVANHLPKYLVFVKQEALALPATTADFTFDGYLTKVYGKPKGKSLEGHAIAAQAAFTPDALTGTRDISTSELLALIKNDILSRTLIEQVLKIPNFVPEQADVKQKLLDALRA